MRDGTPLGKEAKAFIEKGDLVPDSVMVGLIASELKKLGDQPWLLDGFPRTQPQAEALQGETPVNVVVNLDVPFETIIDRIKDRWIHPWEWCRLSQYRQCCVCPTTQESLGKMQKGPAVDFASVLRGDKEAQAMIQLFQEVSRIIGKVQIWDRLPASPPRDEGLEGRRRLAGRWRLAGRRCVEGWQRRSRRGQGRRLAA